MDFWVPFDAALNALQWIMFDLKFLLFDTLSLYIYQTDDVPTLLCYAKIMFVFYVQMLIFV